MRKQNELNASAIKKALKNSFVNVISCYKGKGTTKNATYITIDYKDIDTCLEVFLNLGIVNCLGEFHKKFKCASGIYDFGACYMSDAMYQELNG